MANEPWINNSIISKSPNYNIEVPRFLKQEVKVKGRQATASNSNNDKPHFVFKSMTSAEDYDRRLTDEALAAWATTRSILGTPSTVAVNGTTSNRPN